MRGNAPIATNLAPISEGMKRSRENAGINNTNNTTHNENNDDELHYFPLQGDAPPVTPLGGCHLPTPAKEIKAGYSAVDAELISYYITHEFYGTNLIDRCHRLTGSSPTDKAVVEAHQLW